MQLLPAFAQTTDVSATAEVDILATQAFELGTGARRAWSRRPSRVERLEWAVGAAGTVLATTDGTHWALEP